MRILTLQIICLLVAMISGIQAQTPLEKNGLARSCQLNNKKLLRLAQEIEGQSEDEIVSERWRALNKRLMTIEACDISLCAFARLVGEMQNINVICDLERSVVISPKVGSMSSQEVLESILPAHGLTQYQEGTVLVILDKKRKDVQTALQVPFEKVEKQVSVDFVRLPIAAANTLFEIASGESISNNDAAKRLTTLRLIDVPWTQARKLALALSRDSSRQKAPAGGEAYFAKSKSGAENRWIYREKRWAQVGREVEYRADSGIDSEPPIYTEGKALALLHDPKMNLVRLYKYVNHRWVYLGGRSR